MQHVDAPENEEAVRSALTSVRAGRYEEVLHTLQTAPDQADPRIAFFRGVVYSARGFERRDDELALKCLAGRR